jgi:hypothetical protein
MPASVMRWTNGRVATYPHIRDRPKPGLIAVNSAAGASSTRAIRTRTSFLGMYRSHAEVPSIPAYLICDRRFVREYGLGVIHPVWQSLPYFTKQGYLVSAPTLAELAAKIGVDAAGLEASVREQNRFAETGIDEAFGKGSLALNRHNGDAGTNRIRAWARLPKRRFSRCLCTRRRSARARDCAPTATPKCSTRQARRSAGLYACGNDMSSIMGGNYPGPGITIGPAVCVRVSRGDARGGTRGRAAAGRLTRCPGENRMANASTGVVKSADRVLDLFELLGRWGAEMSHTDLVEALQIPKSSLTQLLRNLVSRGYIEFSPSTKGYRLGRRVHAPVAADRRIAQPRRIDPADPRGDHSGDAGDFGVQPVEGRCR